jgi:hypothetical protein
MSKFGFINEDRKTLHTTLFEVFDRGEEKRGIDLGMGMEFIQDYLKSCYFLSINPLPELRRILPQFEWRFFRSEEGDRGVKQTGDVVNESDLVWFIEGGFHRPFTIVIATHKEARAPKKMFFIGGNKDGTDVKAWAEAFEANLVSP